MNPDSIQNKYHRHARGQMIAILGVSLLLGLSMIFRKHLPEDVFGYCAIAGMVFYALLGLRKFGLAILNPGLSTQMEDERHRLNLLKAKSTAFSATCYAVFLVLGFRRHFQEAPNGTEAMILLVVGMGTLAISYLLLDRAED